MFFFGKFTKPCRHFRTFQLVSQQSLASINNKNPKILTKRPPVATTFPSGTQRLFFLWKAYQTLSSFQNFSTGQPFQNCPTGQPAKLASINNKNPNILTKRPPVATTVPSGIQRHHWGIGIPWYTFGSSIQTEQSHHLPGALLSR